MNSYVDSALLKYGTRFRIVSDRIYDMEISNDIPKMAVDNHAYMNITSRTSVRQYTDMAVSDAVTTALLHAAMSAPSAVNRQPWEFIVVDDPELLAELAAALPYAKMAAHAPLAIVVCGNKERFLEGADGCLWEQDLSAASENILLAAHAFGLGGVWTCLYPHDDRMTAVRAILNIPDNMVPFNLIPVGFPAREHRPVDKWHLERIHYNRL